MKQVPIKEAEGRLEELAQQLQPDEALILTLDGEPIAELRPLPRKHGGLDFEALRRWKDERGIKRVVEYIPDDFDDPLSEDFLITPEG